MSYQTSLTKTLRMPNVSWVSFLATKNALKIAPLTLVVLYFSFVPSVTSPFTDALAEVSQRERERETYHASDQTCLHISLLVPSACFCYCLAAPGLCLALSSNTYSSAEIKRDGEAVKDREMEKEMEVKQPYTVIKIYFFSFGLFCSKTSL